MGNSDVILNSDQVSLHVEFNLTCDTLETQISMVQMHERNFERVALSEGIGDTETVSNIKQGYIDILSTLERLNSMETQIGDVYGEKPALRNPSEASWGDCLEIKTEFDKNYNIFLNRRDGLMQNAEQRLETFSRVNSSDEIIRDADTIGRLIGALSIREEGLASRFGATVDVSDEPETDLDQTLRHIQSFNQHFDKSGDALQCVDIDVTQLGRVLIEAVNENDNATAIEQIKIMSELMQSIDEHKDFSAMRSNSEKISASHDGNNSFSLPDGYTTKWSNPEAMVALYNDNSRIFNSVIKRTDQIKNALAYALADDGELTHEALSDLADELAELYPELSDEYEVEAPHLA